MVFVMMLAKIEHFRQSMVALPAAFIKSYLQFHGLRIVFLIQIINPNHHGKGYVERKPKGIEH